MGLGYFPSLRNVSVAKKSYLILTESCNLIIVMVKMKMGMGTGMETGMRMQMQMHM